MLLGYPNLTKYQFGSNEEMGGERFLLDTLFGSEEGGKGFCLVQKSCPSNSILTDATRASQY